MKNLSGASPKASCLWHYHLPPTHGNSVAAAAAVVAFGYPHPYSQCSVNQ